MMIGLPGSGKSTIAKQELQSKYAATILSSDNYRIKLFNDENDQTHNSEVFSALYSDMKILLSEGRNVIFDATNINIKDRKRCFDVIRNIKNVKVVAYVVNTPFEFCIKRDSERLRVVGYDIISNMQKRFVYPQLFEGFSSITLHYRYAYSDACRQLLDCRMNMFNQQNPWHNYALGEHSNRVANQFDENDVRYEAGKLHDVGKLFTQIFDENGIAHYYGHENVGAYYICSHPEFVKEQYDFADILFYINQHMHIHQIKDSEKAIKKYKALFGEDKFNKLIEFDNADKVLSR